MWKWIFRKPLQRLEAAAKKCYGKKKFLQCQKILKDYKSERNPLKILKAFLVLNLQLCRKINSTTSIFQLICLTFKNNWLSKKTSKKSKNFKIQCILCYCRCIALQFQLLQLVCLTDQWSTFHKTKMSCLSEQ